MKHLALSFALLAATAFGTQDPHYDLIWRPRSSDLLDYKLSLVILVEDYRFRYHSDLRMVVKKVEANGDYEVETTTRNSRIRFQDDEEMSPEEPAAVVERYNAKGERLGSTSTQDDDDDDANPVGKILSEVTSFVPPSMTVGKGDKWTRDTKADEVAKTDDAHVEYEVVGEEKAEGFDVVRVDYKYRQTGVSKPVTASGTFRLKSSDFSIVTFDAEVGNFRMDPKAPFGTAKLSMKRW